MSDSQIIAFDRKAMDALFKAQAEQPEPDREFVPIPEWAPKGADDPSGYGVYVKELTARETAQWRRESTIQRSGNSEINFDVVTVKLVILSAVDDAGRKLFTDADSRKLGSMSSRILERIARAAKRVSGLTEDDDAATRKNSGATEIDDSPTD